MDSKILISFFSTLLLALICLVIAILQFKEKGFLFNNAYIYATKKERLKLNKSPLYRQSAIVFSAISVNFILIAINILLKKQLISYLSIGLMFLLVLYALWSTVKYMTKSI